MKKIFYVIFIILFSVSCEKDDNDLPSNNIPEDGVTGDDWFNATGCRPSDASKIKQGQLYGDNRGCKYLYGSKYIEEVESFWFAKYDQSGNEIWEIIHKDNSFKSHAFNPVELKNGNIVIANVVMESSSDPISVSPVIVDNDGNADYLKVFDSNYIYSDVHVYDDFFFTTVSRQEMDKNMNAANRAAQISNNGEIIRLLPGGTDQISLPKKDNKYIWISDSTYTTISLNSVNKYTVLGYYSYSPLWSFPVSLPDYVSCEMNLSLKDTVITASYSLAYADKTKDIISYNISPFTGKEVVELEDMFFEEKDKTVKEGDSFTLNLVFIPDNASINIIWESSDQSVATVDKLGKITAKSTGKCVIKATTEDGRFESTCNVTVLEPTIEESIKVNVYGSYSSFNGFVTGDVTAAFYNNSSREVEVLEFVMYNTKTNKKVFHETNCGFVKYRNPLKYDLSFELVYKPLYVWRYKIDGKIYEIKYQLGN